MMVFSLAACGDKTPSGSGYTPPSASQEEKQPEELTGFAATKTGKFYSQFEGGKMAMSYEMEYQEQTVKVDSATFGDKTYNKTTTNGTEAVSIIDKEYMYAIDHNTKSVIKMSMANINQPSVDTMIEEGDINMDELVNVAFHNCRFLVCPRY